MNGLYIPLRLTPGVEGVCLRGLKGTDELALEHTGTADLIQLLDSLIRENGSGKKPDASRIVTADRDRVITALYISLYGAKVESIVVCEGCDQKFDIDFFLDELLDHYPVTSGSIPANGTYELEPGIRFRLPTGEDEIGLHGLTEAEVEIQLLKKCLIEGDAETANQKVQQKMTEVAPLLNFEMGAVCPECNHHQQVRFDIQSFFLTRLMSEKPVLLSEIHCIASRYHWSQHEILDLPRRLRKKYADLIKTEE